MKSKRILLVDDSVVARMFILRYMESNYPDWEILQASNAKEAMEILRKNDCDIVSVDYNMPDENGLELIEQIREINKEIKIAMLTANIQNTLKDQVENKGVLFLEKPITGDVVEKIMSL
jgi:CheY-like chemotaxis protein